MSDSLCVCVCVCVHMCARACLRVRDGIYVQVEVMVVALTEAKR